MKKLFLNSLKFAALACSIAFCAYFFTLDPFGDYRRTSLITIPNKEITSNDLEQLYMQMELDKIKESASVDFIENTINKNLERINSRANIDFNKEQINVKENESQLAEQDSNIIKKVISDIRAAEQNEKNIRIAKEEQKFSAYKIPNTHEIKSERNKKRNNVNWVTFLYSNTEIYDAPLKNAKVVYFADKGERAEILKVHNQYLLVRCKKGIDGYVLESKTESDVKF